MDVLKSDFMKVKNIRELFLGLPYDIDFDIQVLESPIDECVLVSYDKHLILLFLKRSDIILLSDQILCSTE